MKRKHSGAIATINDIRGQEPIASGDDHLLLETRELTYEERIYRDIFIRYLPVIKEFLYDNEKFAQCLAHYDNDRYYCPCWFVSNEGRVFSVYRNSVTNLKPYIMWEKRDRTKFPPTKYMVENGYKIPKDGYPKYYYYCGRDGKKVKHQHLVALYHIPGAEGHIGKDSGYEVHHIRAFNWNKSPWENNCADNLQCIPKKPHHEDATKVYHTDMASILTQARQELTESVGLEIVAEVDIPTDDGGIHGIYRMSPETYMRLYLACYSDTEVIVSKPAEDLVEVFRAGDIKNSK